MKKTTDLTEGPIIRQLLLFFLPIAAVSVFQQLYNAVDALVVSRFVGTAALAAVGGSAARVVEKRRRYLEKSYFAASRSNIFSSRLPGLRP